MMKLWTSPKQQNMPKINEQPIDVAPDQVDLQKLLLDMQRLGKPRIHCHDNNKWSCHIDVSISPVGAKFEVRSDFDQETPIAAAMQCNERLASAVASLNGGKQ